MKRTLVWIVFSWLLVLALLVTACAKKTEETAPVVKEAAPVVKEAAPVVQEAAPAVKEAAAAEAPIYGGQLIYGTPTNISGWDELTQPNYSLRNLGLVNEELLTGDWTKGGAGSGERRYVEGGFSDFRSTVGCLAESWEFPDDQTIIFHIRKGVHYALDPNNAASRLAGGRELTADDVAFCVKRVHIDAPNSIGSNWIGRALPLEIYASDKYTVVVKAPPGFLGLTWEGVGENIRIMPPEVAKKYGNYEDWRNNVGSGAFILTDYVPMSSVTWVRNPNYWEKDPIGPGKGNQLPYFDSVKQLIIPDMSTRMAALRTSRIDFDTYQYKVVDAQQLIKSRPQLKYLRYLGGGPIIGMRMDKPGLPFKDIRVRRAMNLGMNNQELCDVLYEGEGELLGYKIAKASVFEGIYTPLDKLPESTRQLYEYHPDKAKQLLAEAGYPDGFKTNVPIAGEDPVLVDRLTMLKAQWAKIGVDIEIRIITNAIWSTMRMQQSYEQMFAGGRSIWNPHIPASCLKGVIHNTSFIDDPKMEEYNQKMTLAFFNRPKRDAVMKEMNLYILDHSWYVTPPIGYGYIFWQPWLKNYHGETDLGVFNGMLPFKYAWLDQALRKSMAGR